MIDIFWPVSDANLFDAYEIEFYQAWVDDLNKLNYKWPDLNRTLPVQSLNDRLVYQSVEQLHSTNAGVNEISHRTLEKESAQLDFIESKCNLKLKRTNPCKFNTNLLITKVESLDDLEYIDKNISPFFPYAVVCVPFNSAFLSTTAMENYFLTFVDDSDFDKCVAKVKRMGFKQQAHFVIEKIRDFYFWSTIEINKIAKPIDYKNKHLFVRNNVANGYASISYLNQNETSLCGVYKAMDENKVCSNLLSAIDRLNWHSNDLASEYCADMDVKTIWLPDIHDGTRLDVASVLVNMGKNLKIIRHFFI